MLAGLAELEPWLAQWHSTPQPPFPASPAEAIRGLLDARAGRRPPDQARRCPLAPAGTHPRPTEGPTLTSLWDGDAFEAVDVTGWDSAEEPMGSRRKAWVRRPGDESHALLMKWARHNEPQDGTAPAIWAEIMAVQVADSLGVPCARVRLARAHDGTYATLARAAADEAAVLAGHAGRADELVHGNELLAVHNLDYDTQKRGKVEGYSLAAVQQALDGLSSLVDGLTAFECFTGYLVLDALIANTDRHHENWGALAAARVLAPSFDHGTAWGFNLGDVAGVDVDRFAAKGRSRHFDDGGTLVDLANRAGAMTSPPTRDHWRAAVQQLDVGALRDTWAQIPADFLSAGRRTFMIDLLSTNRRRLLDDDH